MSSAARQVPPPLNLPFKYRRKSYSSEFEDRPSSGTSSASSLSFPSTTSAQPRSWTYASTSASSSPVASSPPSSAYSSSPPRSHAFRDPVQIRRHPSPHYLHAPRDSIDRDQDIASRHDLLDVDKSYSPSSLTALYTARYGRYAYGYAVPRSTSFAMSSDSEELPLASDLDAVSGSAFSDDVDVDADSELSPDADEFELDMYSPPRRRISFSTSAERDKPYVRPMPPSSSSNSKRSNRTRTLVARVDISPTDSGSSASPPAASSSSSSPAPTASPSTLKTGSIQLPTPPTSSPEDRTPPLPPTMLSAPAAEETPPPERKARSRPTLMDLLSPSPSKPSFNIQDREKSPFMSFWKSGGKPASLPPSSSPLKASSPLPSSSPVKESSPLPESSPLRESSPLPDSSPLKELSPLPSSSSLNPAESPLGETSSLPTPGSPVLSSLTLPSSTLAVSPQSSLSRSSSPSSAQISVFTPSPSQMPLTPPSPALLPSSPELSTTSPMAMKRDINVDGAIACGRSTALGISPIAMMKEISPLRLDMDEDMNVTREDEARLSAPAIEIDTNDDEVDELTGSSDGMKTVTGTPSRVLSCPPSPRPPQSQTRNAVARDLSPVSTSLTAHVVPQVDMPTEHDDQHVASTSVAAPRTPSPHRSASPTLAAASPRLTPLPGASPRVASRLLAPIRPTGASELPSSIRAQSPRSTSSAALHVKREELLLSSPLSSIPSPSVPEGDDAQNGSTSSEEEDVLPRRPYSKKRPGSRLTGDERRKRARVEPNTSEDEEAVDEVPSKAKRASRSRGRKVKARSVALDEVEEDVRSADASASMSGVQRETARSATPHVQPRKRGRRKRQRSLSSSPETHSPARRKVDWDEEAPMPVSEIEGMIIETLATARATSLSAVAIYNSLMASRPALKTAPRRVPPRLQQSAADEDGDEHEVVEPVPLHKHDWLHLITTILTTGHLSSGVFGKVDSSASDSESPVASPMHVSHKTALLSQWFYVPEKDADGERANLIRTMMRGPGKRSETKKYKQYYWKPLGKISRWDPEDDL